jgi:hypothetical protein
MSAIRFIVFSNLRNHNLFRDLSMDEEEMYDLYLFVSVQYTHCPLTSQVVLHILRDFSFPTHLMPPSMQAIYTMEEAPYLIDCEIVQGKPMRNSSGLRSHS